MGVTRGTGSMRDARMESFTSKPLRVHSFLVGVPLNSLDWADLPGGRPGLTIRAISEIIGFGGEAKM
ncbi:MAG: hypothetical protein ABI882_20105, partial [Acidobacteriota bacterium]